MFFLYCTEIAMIRFRGRSGISDYKNIFNAIILTKIYFPACFGQLRFIFTVKWVGLGLGVVKGSKSLNRLLIK